MFGTGRFTTRQMAREDFMPNLVGAVILTACCLMPA
jgi:hypothetical protein